MLCHNVDVLLGVSATIDPEDFHHFATASQEHEEETDRYGTMTAPPSGTCIWLAANITDMLKLLSLPRKQISVNEGFVE